MNNPNPFVPKGSLLEQQSQRRSRLKLAVFCVLAVSVTGLVAMLIQGCKRENPDQNPTAATPAPETNPAPLDMSNTNNTLAAGTNMGAPMTPPAPVTNTLPPVPIAPVTPAVPAPETTATGTEYVVVAGDTFGKIAKAHGVTVKAMEAANPGVDSKKLKLKQKLIIPPATSGATATPGGTGAMSATATPDTGSGDVYVVKSNDNLSKIAKKHGVSVKALKAANNLTTDHIKVGEKLKIPAKAESAPLATPAPTPAPDTSAAPVLPPTSVPAPTPGH